MEVRKAEYSDFEDVFGLLEQLWPDYKMDKKAMLNVFEAAVDGANDFAFCAVSEGRVIGFCAGVFAASYWYCGNAGYISTMIVDEELRGNKIGAALLKAVEEFAAKTGCTAISIDSAFHREGAHRFYESHGYVKAGYAFEKNLEPVQQ